jgi:hypothetical protein
MEIETKVYNFAAEKEEAYFTVKKHCSWCGETVHIDMSIDQYNAYANKTSYVQDIFPHVSKENREMLISGTHPHCWNEMFAELDEEEEEEINEYSGNE